MPVVGLLASGRLVPRLPDVPRNRADKWPRPPRWRVLRSGEGQHEYDAGEWRSFFRQIRQFLRRNGKPVSEARNSCYVLRVGSASLSALRRWEMYL